MTTSRLPVGNLNRNLIFRELLPFEIWTWKIGNDNLKSIIARSFKLGKHIENYDKIIC